MKGRILAGAVTAVCLALAGCGGGGGDARTLSASAGRAGTVSHHQRARQRPVSPATRRLRTALTAALRRAGPNTGAEVYDLTAHETLFSLRPNSIRPPASVEKLYTTVALLGKFRPSTRLHTTILGTGRLGVDGTWHGNLYLRGDGDPTFGDGGFNRNYEMGYGPTAVQLASQLARRGIHRVSGHVIADESLFDLRRGGLLTGFAIDVPDFGGQLSALTYDHGSTDGKLSPAEFAVKQLTATMKAMHIQAAASTTTGAAPRHAHKLASVRSPTLAVLIDLMNYHSDDLFAELLTKQLGARFGRGGTIGAGAHVIAREVARRYGIHPKILDGSGLSHDDRSSPRQVVTLLRRVWHTPAGHVLLPSLPVVGVNGTTRRIAVGTPAQGNCIGKTGTLNYVTNLAGYCHAHGGHMLAYGLFLDGPGNEQAIQMLGPMMAAIAKY